MNAEKIKNIGEVVQYNNLISDAENWGYLACDFFLKMREYYRWENGMKPDQSIDNEDFAEWLSRKQKLWNEYHDRKYKEVDGNPPDSKELVIEILKRGYAYGYKKVFPRYSFFLAEIDSEYKRNGYRIFITGKELARDIISPKAILIESIMFIRKDAIERYIYVKKEEADAVRTGMQRDVFDNISIEELVKKEMELSFYHLIAEKEEQEKLTGRMGCDVVDRVGGDMVELLGVLSDRGKIAKIIEEKDKVMLAYTLLTITCKRPIINELFEAYEKKKSWKEIDEVRRKCYKKVLKIIEEKPEKGGVCATV